MGDDVALKCCGKCPGIGLLYDPMISLATQASLGSGFSQNSQKDDSSQFQPPGLSQNTQKFDSSQFETGLALA